MRLLSFYWPSPLGKPREDFEALATGKKNILIVADGVTRKGFQGPYPNPSPASLAANRFAEAALKTLVNVSSKSMTTADLYTAADAGNREVLKVNRELNFWGKTDYWGHDLAGTLAAMLVIQEPYYLYGFMTDCGVAQLNPSGTLQFRTPDCLAPAQAFFPSIEECGSEQERFMRVRRDFRNVGGAKNGGFGTFTGEEMALHYWEMGKKKYSEDDVLLCYSDGFAPFLGQVSFHDILLRGDREEIEIYVAARSTVTENNDEKTLLVAYT